MTGFFSNQLFKSVYGIYSRSCNRSSMISSIFWSMCDSSRSIFIEAVLRIGNQIYRLNQSDQRCSPSYLSRRPVDLSSSHLAIYIRDYRESERYLHRQHSQGLLSRQEVRSGFRRNCVRAYHNSHVRAIALLNTISASKSLLSANALIRDINSSTMSVPRFSCYQQISLMTAIHKPLPSRQRPLEAPLSL